jgi:hypothetical protein
MEYSKGDIVKGVDIYDNRVEGKIDGIVKSFGTAVVRIQGRCYGTIVDLTNGSVIKVKGVSEDNNNKQRIF